MAKRHPGEMTQTGGVMLARTDIDPRKHDGRHCTECNVPLWPCESVGLPHEMAMGTGGLTRVTLYERVDRCMSCQVSGKPQPRD